MLYVICTVNSDEPSVFYDEAEALRTIEEMSKSNVLKTAYRAGVSCEQFIDKHWVEMEYTVDVDTYFEEIESTFSDADEAISYAYRCREDNSCVSLYAEDIFEYDFSEDKWYRF